MNELIKIETNENQEPCVSGRVLHEFLEVKEKYTQWFERMKDYGFDEDVDFASLSDLSEKPLGGRPAIDHVIKLDMAKEIAMIQRTEKGKQARRYFIEVEKKFKKQLTPANLLLQQAQLMVEHEERLLSAEKGIKRLEHNIRREQTSEHLTVIAYANIKGISPKSYRSSSIGKKATKICKDEHLPMGSVVDSKYGHIHTYPSEVLDRIFFA